jgi:hypothetical protein
VADLYIENDNNIVIRGLRVAATGVYVSDATLTANVYDQNGSLVSGATSISVPYVAASSGEYRGLIPSTVQLTAGTRYKIVVLASNYGVKLSKWFNAVERTG